MVFSKCWVNSRTLNALKAALHLLAALTVCVGPKRADVFNMIHGKNKLKI